MTGHTFIVGEIVAPVQRGLSAEAARRVLEIARQEKEALWYRESRIRVCKVERDY